MEETPTGEVKPESGTPTVRQGCILIIGGAALGFFGCLGAISIRSDLLIFVFLGLSAIVMFWGLVKIAMVVWRRMSRPLDHDRN